MLELLHPAVVIAHPHDERDMRPVRTWTPPRSSIGVSDPDTNDGTRRAIRFNKDPKKQKQRLGETMNAEYDGSCISMSSPMAAVRRRSGTAQLSKASRSNSASSERMVFASTWLTDKIPWLLAFPIVLTVVRDRMDFPHCDTSRPGLDSRPARPSPFVHLPPLLLCIPSTAHLAGVQPHFHLHSPPRRQPLSAVLMLDMRRWPQLPRGLIPRDVQSASSLHLLRKRQ
nr:hypothetical protein CFP56_41356 [Quercus suber]